MCPKGTLEQNEIHVMQSNVSSIQYLPACDRSELVPWVWLSIANTLYQSLPKCANFNIYFLKRTVTDEIFFGFLNIVENNI